MRQGPGGGFVSRSVDARPQWRGAASRALAPPAGAPPESFSTNALSDVTNNQCAQVAAEAKDIVFGNVSRGKLQAGVDKLADVVGSTLGPRGESCWCCCWKREKFLLSETIAGPLARGSH